MAYLILLLISIAAATEPNVPKTNLDFWNGTTVEDNNCYNYATNRRTNSFAQPGEASGVFINELHCPEVYAAASADLGLKPAAFFPYGSKRDETLIALVVWPGEDFHWYRRDDSGFWTHKMGDTPATTVDNSGRRITDPRTADRDVYTEFCGFFKITNYIYSADEQNGGMVRIGTMNSIPDPPSTSELEVMMYSGRPNPRHPLRNDLSDPQFKEDLERIREQLSSPKATIASDVPAFSKLGYRGIQIIDREGLIFPKGSRVQILDRNVIARLPNSRRPLGVTLRHPIAFERALLR